jgi:twitching motility two-component system response regulator PilG
MTYSRLAGMRVMVVDDSYTTRRSAEIFLQEAGCQVILAESGFDALAKIGTNPPALILMDIIMPSLDGYQTCALIRKSGQHGATPVVMMSSNDSMFDRGRGRALSSSEYLTKPFTKESLLKVVSAQLFQRVSGGDETRAPRSGPFLARSTIG